MSQQSNRRITLPTVPPPKTLVACTDCAKCCTYVAIDVNGPTSPKNATDLLWFLYHEGVSIYVDGDNTWSVVFEARCRNLREDRLCGVYEQRPHVCRTFDANICEVNDPENGYIFASAEELLAWMQKRRPKLYAKIAIGHLPERYRPAPTPALAVAASKQRRASRPARRSRT